MPKTKEVEDAVVISETNGQPEDKLGVVIKKSLVKNNVTDAILNELLEKSKDLTIKGVDDKEGYEAVHAMRMNYVKTRGLIVRVCKDGREDAKIISQKWIAKEKELVARITPEEERLEKLEKDIDAEKERSKQERMEMERTRLRTRTSELLAMGAVNDGIDVYLDDVSFSLTDIRESEEEDYQSDILPQFKKIFDQKESVRLENERIQNEKQAQLDKQRADFERQQNEFRQQQEQFEKEKKEAAQKKRNARIYQLESIGLTKHASGNYFYSSDRLPGQGHDNVFLTTVVKLEEIEVDDIAWNDIIIHQTKVISDIKQQYKEAIEKDENERQEKLREKAAAELRVKERTAEVRALGYVSNEYAVFVYKDSTEWSQTSDKCVNSAFIYDATPEEWEIRMKSLKAHADAEVIRVDKEKQEKFLADVAEKNRQEQLRKQEEADQASDKEKWETFVSQLNQVKLPTMKRQPYKDYVDTAASFIKRINAIKK